MMGKNKPKPAWKVFSMCSTRNFWQN